MYGSTDSFDEDPRILARIFVGFASLLFLPISILNFVALCFFSHCCLHLPESYRLGNASIPRTTGRRGQDRWAREVIP